MKRKEIVLPSNKKFGLFFSFVFLIICLFFSDYNFSFFEFVLIFTAVIFFILGIGSSAYLTPLNKIWFYFGFYLGKIISPLVIGFIFYFLISPLAIILRFFGRDELKLTKNNSKSYWVIVNEDKDDESLKRQF